MTSSRLRTILFDLDGTLADTAPDLAYALNTVLQEEARPALPLATIRPVVSHGSKALLQLGFAIGPEDSAYAALRQRLLTLYLHHIADATRLFPGMLEVLDSIEQAGMRWGVVTNKPASLTEPLLEKLGLSARAACIVSGDTLSQSKPHPAPLLHACNLAASQAHQCLFIGDAQCDIEAGQRAGMKTLVALFGYISAQDDPRRWGADGMVSSPQDIMAWISAHEAAQQQPMCN